MPCGAVVANPSRKRPVVDTDVFALIVDSSGEPVLQNRSQGGFDWGCPYPACRPSPCACPCRQAPPDPCRCRHVKARGFKCPRAHPGR